MPRATRVFEEGRICHVYNRVGGGLAPFADEKMAQVFVDLLGEVAQRDTLQILGWSLLGNHYHLIIRQGPVEISRPMKTLQQRTTRARNLRDRVWGSLWQGRFKAKDVTTSSYLMQLIAYVHLNPVKAGLADNAAGYRWSGHRDIIGLRRKPIVAIDEALLTYGETRRRALKAYRSSIDMVSVEEWSSEGPGQLPWWSLGRPADEERLNVDHASLDQLGRRTARWRPKYNADDWVNLVCAALDVDKRALADRGRSPEIVRARELLGLVGIERFGVKVGDLAQVLEKSRGGVSKWYRRGVIRRAQEPEFADASRRIEDIASEDP